jgi:hypothetical protein
MPVCAVFHIRLQSILEAPVFSGQEDEGCPHFLYLGINSLKVRLLAIEQVFR